MARALRGVGWALLLLAVVLVAVWRFGPREPIPGETRFDPAALGADLDAYFAAREAAVPGIRPGQHKRVIWAGAPGARTDLALLYLHGFSASSEELRPVPDRIAAALGANLVFTRLTGHGRDGPAMAEATVADWMRDVAEGLAAARRAGREVVVMGTSTGATLATLAAADPALMEGVRGVILVSPNYAMADPRAGLLTWPFARRWLPQLLGETRGLVPHNAGHAAAWTTEYPSVALLPMAALVAHVRRMDHAAIPVPALFWFSEADTVVRADATRRVAGRWGGPVALTRVTPGPGDAPDGHVLAGDILSPGQTDAAVAGMTGWIRRVIEGK